MTEIEKAFANEWVDNGGNAAAAARAIGLMAHPAKRGYDLLHRPGVQAHIEVLTGSTTAADLANKVGSATLTELQGAIDRLIELCGPL